MLPAQPGPCLAIREPSPSHEDDPACPSLDHPHGGSQPEVPQASRDEISPLRPEMRAFRTRGENLLPDEPRDEDITAANGYLILEIGREEQIGEPRGVCRGSIRIEVD